MHTLKKLAVVSIKSKKKILFWKYHILLTDKEDQFDVEIYEEFQKLNKEVKVLSRLTAPDLSELQRLVFCHREMYKLGKSKYASPLVTALWNLRRWLQEFTTSRNERRIQK